MTKLARTILVADEQARPDAGRDQLLERLRTDALDGYAKFFAQHFNATISHVRLQQDMALELLEAMLEVMYDSSPPKLAILPTDGPSEQDNTVDQRILTGTLAEEIIRNAPIPVLAVGKNAQRKPLELEALKNCRILVATDFGVNSRKAERYAMKLAKQLKARITLIHCLFEGRKLTPQSPLGSLSTMADAATLKKSLLFDTFQDLKKRAAPFAKKGIDCDVVLNDHITLAASGIVAEAEKADASFIVMGTHASNAFHTASLGSTCRAVIHHAPVPVFIVPNSDTP